MKYFVALLLLISAHTISFSQITFDKGYFIDNQGQRVECLIRNKDSEVNVTGFIYKTGESGEKERKRIEDVVEFGIYGYCKYIRAKVKMDHSSPDLGLMSTHRNPEMIEGVLLLKVVLEGPASLYSHTDGTMTRFFYKTGNAEITQLVYKKYLVDRRLLAVNQSFRQQLWLNVNCNKVALKSMPAVNYDEESLVKYFKDNNQCAGDSSRQYRTVKKENFFHLKIAPGITYTTIGFRTGDGTYDLFDFGSKFTYRIGLEAEITLPYTRQKWRFVVEPTFQDFESKPMYPQPYTTQLKFKSIEFPIGLRYYSFLSKNVKLFYNAFYISNYSINFNTAVSNSTGIYWKLDPNSSFALGAGVTWKRLSLEGRYYTNRSLFNFLFYGENIYTRSAVVFGYRIF